MSNISRKNFAPNNTNRIYLTSLEPESPENSSIKKSSRSIKINNRFPSVFFPLQAEKKISISNILQTSKKYRKNKSIYDTKLRNNFASILDAKKNNGHN